MLPGSSIAALSAADAMPSVRPVTTTASETANTARRDAVRTAFDAWGVKIDADLLGIAISL
jgi:hypothetical protein